MLSVRDCESMNAANDVQSADSTQNRSSALFVLLVFFLSVCFRFRLYRKTYRSKDLNGLWRLTRKIKLVFLKIETLTTETLNTTLPHSYLNRSIFRLSWVKIWFVKYITQNCFAYSLKYVSIFFQAYHIFYRKIKIYSLFTFEDSERSWQIVDVQANGDKSKCIY